MSSPLSLKSFGGSHIIFAAPCTSSVPPTLTSPFLALISLPCQWTESPNLQIIIWNTLHWHALPWAHTTIIIFYINCCIHHLRCYKTISSSFSRAYFKRLELLLAAPQATLTLSFLNTDAWTNCEMLEMIIYKQSSRRWRFDCNIHFMNVYSQKFHANRNIANNIKFKIDESSGV